MTELAASYDVVCIGGAMMGSATAYFLTENPDFDGTVLVVEPDWTYASAQTTRAQNSIREQFTNELNIRLMPFRSGAEGSAAILGGHVTLAAGDSIDLFEA